MQRVPSTKQHEISGIELEGANGFSIVEYPLDPVEGHVPRICVSDVPLFVEGMEVEAVPVASAGPAT